MWWWVVALAAVLPVSRLGGLITIYPDSLHYLSCDWNAWECLNGPLYPALVQVIPWALLVLLQQVLLGVAVGLLALVATRAMSTSLRVAVFVFLALALQTPGVASWSSAILTESISLALVLLAGTSLLIFLQERGRRVWPLLGAVGWLALVAVVSVRVAVVGLALTALVVVIAAVVGKVPRRRSLALLGLGLLVTAGLALPTYLRQSTNLVMDYAVSRDYIYGSFDPGVRAAFDALAPACSTPPTSRETYAEQCPERVQWWSEGHPTVSEMLDSGALQASVLPTEGLAFALAAPPVYGGDVLSFDGVTGAVPAPANQATWANLLAVAALPMLSVAAVMGVLVLRRRNPQLRRVWGNPILLGAAALALLIPIALVVWAVDGLELRRHLLPWTQLAYLAVPLLGLMLSRPHSTSRTDGADVAVYPVTDLREDLVDQRRVARAANGSGL